MPVHNQEVIRILEVLLLATLACSAQDRDAWTRPFPAHRMIANVYYVGTSDLAVYLITTPAGHILINTGLKDSAPLIGKSIRDLGFKFEDVRILTTMQAHYDHVAAFAEIKKQTGAKVFATAADALLLEDGGASDYLFGPEFQFAPVKVDRKLTDGEKIALGGIELTVHVHPGHTKGSASFTMKVAEAGRVYKVAIMNMGSINPGTRFYGNTKYPRIAEDYAATFRKQKELPCEVFLSAHASQFGMRAKYKLEYDPAAYVDPAMCKQQIESYQANFRKQLEEQRPSK